MEMERDGGHGRVGDSNTINSKTPGNIYGEGLKHLDYIFRGTGAAPKQKNLSGGCPRVLVEGVQRQKVHKTEAAMKENSFRETGAEITTTF